MYYFIDAICSIADILFLYILASGFFSRKKEKHGVIAVSYCVFGLALLFLSANPHLVLIRTAFWSVGGSILVWIVFDAKPVSTAFVCLSFLGIGGLTEIAVMPIMSLLGVSNQALMEIGDARILYIIISHIVALLLVVLIRFSKGISTGDFSAKILLPVFPSLAITILFCVLLGSDIFHGKDMNPLYLIIASGLLYTEIVIVFYTISLQEKENTQHSLELANHHYAMQKEYYEQFHSQQEQTQALWHDIKKYIRAVEAEGNSSESLGQLQKAVDSITSVVDVKNRVVNIILNEYVQIAKQEETEFALDVRIPSELSITAADLYIILGNTLDNALDACGKLPKEERKISLQLLLHNQMLFYRISNPYTPEYLTRKRSRFHGYGLKNVRECATRNNGTMDISTDNNQYTVTVLINCL